MFSLVFQARDINYAKNKDYDYAAMKFQVRAFVSDSFLHSCQVEVAKLSLFFIHFFSCELQKKDLQKENESWKSTLL
jgi:hypothetical protein